MEFTRLPIWDAWHILPQPHADERGRFLRAWCAREFGARGIAFEPVQANMGLSRLRGTVRGLHYQVEPAPEAKLVRCTRGSIFDVVVDLRPDSPTYRRWCGVELSAENAAMLYVPACCGHGYQALEDDTEMHYLTSAYYTPDAVRGARFDDPAIGIRWPLPATAVSDQDRGWPLLDTPGAARAG